MLPDTEAELLDLIERFQAEDLRGVPWAAWVELAAHLGGEWRDCPAPCPVAFRTHEHRLQVYTLRAAHGVALQHPGDVAPPVETLPDVSDPTHYGGKHYGGLGQLAAALKGRGKIGGKIWCD